MRSFRRWLMASVAVFLIPGAAVGQMCYPGSSLCFTPDRFWVEFTGLTDGTVRASSYWEGWWSSPLTDVYNYQLYWNIMDGAGTTYLGGGARQDVVTPFGEILSSIHTDYDNPPYTGSGGFAIGDPEDLDGPWSGELTGMAVYLRANSDLAYTCGITHSPSLETNDSGVPCDWNSDVVPEPATLLLLGTGLLGVGLAVRRRRPLDDAGDG